MQSKGFPMPSLIRPGICSDKSQDALVKTSGLELNSGITIDETEVGDSETRNPKLATRPVAPTKVQLDEHYPLHFNYRSWCPDCVWGKGHAKHHRSSEEGVKEHVTLAYG